MDIEHYPMECGRLAKELDDDLRTEENRQDWVAYLVPAVDDDGGSLHVVWNQEHGRAGLVYVGSGSDGRTFWTDASDVPDAVRRWMEDDLRP